MSMGARVVWAYLFLLKQYTSAFYNIQQKFLYPVKGAIPQSWDFYWWPGFPRLWLGMERGDDSCSRSELSRMRFTILCEACSVLYHIWLSIVRVWYGVSLVDRTKLRKTLRAWIMLSIGNANVWTSTHNKIVLLPLSQLNRIYPYMHPKLSMLLRIVLRAGQLGLRLVIPLTNGWNMANGQ